MNLQEAQTLFWRCVRYQPMPDELHQAFVSKRSLSADARLGIYQRMYWYRQVDALFDTFPKTAALLGTEVFTRIVSAYIARHPSEHGHLERLGRRLPEFLATELSSFVAVDSEVARVRSQMARLEWAHLEALLAPDAFAVASPCDITPETFAAARLAFAPSLRVLRVGEDVLDLWRAPSAAPSGRRTPVFVCVERPRFATVHSVLSDDEGEALAAAVTGKTMAEVCEVFERRECSLHRAWEVVGRWFERAWICGVHTDTERTGA